MVVAPTRRRTADERREQILVIAIKHFAVGGYRGTATDVIAGEAGSSQAYLFRLFPTKQELFPACDQRACETVYKVFRHAAAAAPPGEKLAAMGRAYTDQLLPDRHAVLMMMRGFAAAGADREIRRHVREKSGDMVVEVAELAFEHALMSERTMDGLAAARARGRAPAGRSRSSGPGRRSSRGGCTRRSGMTAGAATRCSRLPMSSA